MPAASPRRQMQHPAPHDFLLWCTKIKTQKFKRRTPFFFNKFTYLLDVILASLAMPPAPACGLLSSSGWGRPNWDQKRVAAAAFIVRVEAARIETKRGCFEAVRRTKEATKASFLASPGWSKATEAAPYARSNMRPRVLVLAWPPRLHHVIFCCDACSKNQDAEL
jgi:hypothetical protein